MLNNLTPSQQQYDRQVAYWLLLCAVVIFGMILLGGVTRLTDSGLSMVDWKPIKGIIPPITQADWQAMFAKYQQFPEYQKTNFTMTLEEFKPIFMYEYLHRMLGRFIGIIFVLPFLFFYFTKRIAHGLTPRLVVMLLLGGSQGLLGWYMVKSGLVDNPHVSQYRLTAHLGLAVFIYGFIVWTVLDLLAPKLSHPKHLKRFSYTLSSLIFLMILSGGLVAGTRAGIPYPTWPLMGDSFIPPGLYSLTPFWLSAFEDMLTIQFNHRMFAYLIVVLVVTFAYKALKSDLNGPLKIAIYCFLILLVAQVTLGISTLIFYIPVPVAAAHQVCAVALLTASLFVSHCFSNQMTARES
ncbi:COX15/CtaA family protein [Porticoccaceae bacterium]|jgi:cytochrome c oxidase assembly protein subunit 15|nr:COX15/CtaA family protein [Porticoccaceae bacterium]MDA8597825.1 COX15/CtaA family protein [Porticoccaceae bacterium]MDA8878136.1 COX15/CtaA family protein [Porticoccaceae bacterium]MDA8941266.1 COX15/CtaA family protein [Porticoccaceae bacterium]MDA9583533.1 COX15/CtaA family protein [Porticoccaceae bacterium]